MTHYTLAASPFGNFAMQRTEPDTDAREIERYYLIPIGQLEAVPLTRLHGGDSLYLDQDALTAEAHRQLEERGTAAVRYLSPRPEYVINRAIYTDDLYATLRRGYSGADDYWTVNTGRYGQSLTDSARTKLTAWWESARESIVTPEFLARDAVDRAEYAMQRTFRAMVEARDAAEVANAAHDAAITAWHAATDALGAL